MILVRVPSIGDSDMQDFENLFRLCQELQSRMPAKVRLEFSACDELEQNAVAFLGGMMRWMEYSGGRVEVDATTLPSHLSDYLADNGFLKSFPTIGVAGPGQTGAIPYREDRQEAEPGIAVYLRDRWLDGISLDRRSADLAVSMVRQIHSNAFQHSLSDIGTFTCGRQSLEQRRLKISVVDFGIGMPARVRGFVGRTALPADEAMAWVFEPGNSTSPESHGGTGLSRLRAFILANDGLLEVFSHEGYAKVSPREELFLRRDIFFRGTLVNMSLPVDVGSFGTTATVSPAKEIGLPAGS